MRGQHIRPVLECSTLPRTAELTLVTLGLLKKTPIAAGWGSLRERNEGETGGEKNASQGAGLFAPLYRHLGRIWGTWAA